MREELAHLFFHLLDCKVLTGILVYLVGKLCAVVNHLLHSHILLKLAILVAVDAVILTAAAVGVCPFVIVSQRHSATLTEILFHVIFPQRYKLFPERASDSEFL